MQPAPPSVQAPVRRSSWSPSWRPSGTSSDTVTAVAAIHALGEVPGRLAEREMAQMLGMAVNGFDAHAAWAVSLRPASPALIEPLTETVARGGLAGMHAQQVLARWASQDTGIASAVLVALDAALRETGVATSRRYLAEVAGLVPGPVGRRLLERLATDASEASAVRVEAVASLGDRVGERLPPSVTSLASQGGPIGEAVRQARALQVLRRRGPRRSHTREDGLKIAQVHLGAVLDAEATRAGVGDAGGVATLLPRLGAALAAQPRIHEIISIGRALPGVPARTRLREQPAMGGHRFENVALEEGEGATFAGDWPSLVAAERGIRAALLASGTPDVLHLRMADPGSLAAARVAHELGIPTVFTLAPDPHGPIAAAERRGTLDRRDLRDGGRAGGTLVPRRASWHGWPTRPASWSSSRDPTCRDSSPSWWASTWLPGRRVTPSWPRAWTPGRPTMPRQHVRPARAPPSWTTWCGPSSACLRNGRGCPSS